LTFSCSRIVIEGETSFSIQGVNLREDIEQFVKTPFNGKSLDIKGKIRNLKEGKVEIICFGSDVNKLFNELDKWKNSKDNNKQFKIKNLYKFSYGEEDKFGSFDDFIIERSDDQSEMVWALRGAGRRFEKAADALEKINDNLLERDKKIAAGRLLTLYHELMHNRNVLSDAERNKDRLLLEAMKANIGWPAIPDDSFANSLGEIFSDFNDFKKGIMSDDALFMLREKIEKFTRTIKFELSSIGRGVPL
jgi:acylphosphatase